MEIYLQTIPRMVINLETRPDRLERFRTEEKKVFPTDTPVFKAFLTTGKNRGMVGCAKSHIGVVMTAKKEGWPMVLIMEDDCMFRGDTAGALEAYQNVPDDFDLALGGVYQVKKVHNVKGNQRWKHIENWCSTHFYVVRDKAYDKIIKDYDQTKHIDRWLSEQSGLKAYVCNPMFAEQAGGMSDNVGKVVDYNYMLPRLKNLGLQMA